MTAKFFKKHTRYTSFIFFLDLRVSTWKDQTHQLTGHALSGSIIKAVIGFRSERELSVNALNL